MADAHTAALHAAPGAVLSVRDLSIRFSGQSVFEGLSFDLPAGSRTFLAGPSGGGKTSLFKTLLGFVEPAAGEVAVLGRPLDRHSVWSIRREIGYVPQEPDPGDLTARQFLEGPFAYKANHHSKLNQDSLNYWMDFFGLSGGLLDQPCTSLSGGQKQRFAVILIILLNRSLILLDEPTSALDASSRQALRRWIAEATDKTFLIISHDPELERMAQRTVDLGRVRGGAK